MFLADVSGTGLLAVIGIGAAIGLVIFAFGAQADERSIVRSSLRQLEGYEVENVRDQELLNPLRDRAVMPVLKSLTDLGRRFTPVGYVDKVRMKFVYAGEPKPGQPASLLSASHNSLEYSFLTGASIWEDSGVYRRPVAACRAAAGGLDLDRCVGWARSQGEKARIQEQLERRLRSFESRYE